MGLTLAGYNRFCGHVGEFLLFMVWAPWAFFLFTAIAGVIVGVDLYGITEPSPVPRWWGWITSLTS